MMTRRRGRWIRLSLPPALLYAVGVCAIVALTVAAVVPVWAAVLILAAAGIALFVPIRGRVLLIEWIAVAVAFLRRRRRPLREPLPPAVDISVISGEAGVRWDGHTLVTAIEVAADVALTSESAGRIISGSELPLSLVASLMSQYGLAIDIDIVSCGRHVPPGTAYRTVYAQSVGPRHIVGQRRTWLVLRLNDLANLDGVVERGPSRRAAPKALAAATHRAVQRLNQEQIRAYALSADELEAVVEALLEPVGDSDTCENWSAIRSGPNFIATYIADPRMLADGQLDRWWSWRAEDVVMTIRLTHNPGGQPQVGVLMRYVHHGKAYRPLAEAKLSLPTGAQRALLQAALPAGDVSMQTVLPTVDLSAVESVRVPIGPSGQIIGQSDDGGLVAVPLWDQSGHPKRLRVDARVGVEVGRQLVLRAVVTGAVVAIHTDDRHRWEGLIATVNDPQRLFYATAGARTSDIAVFDGRPVATVPTRTVLRLLSPQNATSGGADMTLVEEPGQLLEVTIGGAQPVMVWIIRTREEDRYLGLGQVQAPPRRVVSTQPAISRSTRRAGSTPPPDQAPPRRPRTVVPAAPPQNPPALPAGQRNGEPVSAGRHHREMGGPQRTPRSQRADTPPPAPPPRPRRDFGLPPHDGHPPRPPRDPRDR